MHFHSLLKFCKLMLKLPTSLVPFDVIFQSEMIKIFLLEFLPENYVKLSGDILNNPKAK